MAVRIEILSAKPTLMKAALYYAIPAPQRLPGAVDVTRVPAGVRLSPTEVNQLRQGALYELVREFNIIPASTAGDIQGVLEREWNRNRQFAMQEYRKKYTNTQFNGFFWDGASWSNP